MDLTVAALWTGVGGFLTDNTLVVTVVTALVFINVAFIIGRKSKAVSR
jgi:hypothetical protein